MIPLLHICALFLTVAAAQDSPPERLAQTAVDLHPGLDALSARADALAQRVDTAGAWSDPQLALEWSNVPLSTLSLADSPMSGAQVRLEQQLRPPGWSRHRRSSAELNALAAEHAQDEAALQLRVHVHRTWWMLVRAHHLQRVTQQHLARTEELLAAVRTRYETGAGGQHAILRLQVQRDLLREEDADFLRLQRELQAALAEALGGTEPDGWGIPESVASTPPPEPSNWSNLAAAHRPIFAQLASQSDGREASANAARADGLPDVRVWVGYRVRTINTPTDPGTDLVSGGVAVPLPTNSARAARSESDAQLAEANALDADTRRLAQQIDAQMDAVSARWSRSFDKASVYEGQLMPAADAALETAQADFVQGLADFGALFEAETTVLSLQRTRIEAAIDTHLARAETLGLLGVFAGEDPK